LRSQFIRQRTRHPVANAAIRHGLDKGIYKGRAAAADAVCGRIDVILHHSDLSGCGKDGFRKIKFLIRTGAQAGNQAHTLSDCERRIGHDAHKTRGVRQRILQHFIGPPGNDGNDEFVVQRIVNLSNDVRSVNGLDGQQNAIDSLNQRKVVLHNMNTLSRQFRAFFRVFAADVNAIGRKRPFIQNTAYNGRAHVARADKTKFHN